MCEDVNGGENEYCVSDWCGVGGESVFVCDGKVGIVDDDVDV